MSAGSEIVAPDRLGVPAGAGAAAWAAPRRVTRHWELRVGFALLAAYVLLAVVGPLVVTADPLAQDVAAAFEMPSSAHPLGTDELGRDVLARVIAASRLDMLLGFVCAAIPALFGTALGTLAGYFGGWLDAIAMRVVDVMLTIPVYPLIMAVLFVLEPGAGGIIVSFALVGWTPFARLARGQAASVARQEFITAARVSGLGTPRIIVRHVLPNITRQQVMLATTDVMFCIIAISTLSYLGVGIQPPTPEWGTLVQQGVPVIDSRWWIVVVPAVLIAGLGLALSLVADGLAEDERR